MYRSILVAVCLLLACTHTAFAETSAFTITPDMTREEKLTLLRAHVEFLQRKILELQAAGAAHAWFVQVDYQAQEMQVSRSAGGVPVLTIPGTATTTIARTIAAASGERESVVQSQIRFEYSGGDEIVAYTAEMLSPYRVNLLRTRGDGRVERETVSRADINAIVAANFFGNERIYEEVLGSYVKDIRRGQMAPEIVTIAASLFGVTTLDVADKLTIDVKRYKRS
jgi:hypothetical protein